MVKIIETHLSLESGEIKDHQARIIEASSWSEYVEEIKNAKTVNRNGTLYGVSLPKQSIVSNLLCDEFHLSCDVFNGFADFKKFAYLVNDKS